MKIKNSIYKISAICALALFTACSSDFLETKPTEYPDEESISGAIKDDPAKVQAYVAGAYYNLYSGGDYRTAHDNGGLPAIRLALELMAGDVAYPRDQHFFRYDYSLENRMSNYRRPNTTWKQLYNVIDNANSVISLLRPEEGKEPSDKAKILLGEAHSLRAYCYFLLINIWQNPYGSGKDQLGIPLKTDQKYRQERVPVGEVYTQILADIEQGYNYLKGKGFHNNKVGLSEYAAAGIYANVLMFTGDYAKAATYAEAAAAGGSFNTESDMLSGFNSLSMPEVLWGYGVTNQTSIIYISFFSHVDPYSMGYGGSVGFRKMISSELYSRIADNDVRKQWFGYNETYNWRKVDFSYETNGGFMNYLQNKFVDSFIVTKGNGTAFSSDIIYMRTAEMYFVAAEAHYLNGDEAKARESLNTIMATRIPGYSYAGSGTELYNEICLQKRIETWLEGCRLLDAKRRGETIDRSTSTNHSTSLGKVNALVYKAATDSRMIYMIPDSEIQNNPAITENNP